MANVASGLRFRLPGAIFWHPSGVSCDNLFSPDTSYKREIVLYSFVLLVTRVGFSPDGFSPNENVETPNPGLRPGKSYTIAFCRRVFLLSWAVFKSPGYAVQFASLSKRTSCGSHLRNCEGVSE